jgi:DHA2 family multidrug resistance protein
MDGVTTSAGPSAAAAAPARSGNRKWIVALSVTFGTLMGAIDASIVNVALSQIRSAVGATMQEITWISTGFAIATVLVMPLTGFFGRLFGQKNVYLFCLLLFVLGSALCGFSWSLPSLVLFRVIQGLGAGALQPTEQAILRQTFPPAEQGTAMALFSVAVMVGPAFGPTLGGWIVDNFHWSWIFFINVPVGIFGFFMVWRFVEEPEDIRVAMRAQAEKQRRNMDWIGIAILWTTLIALQYLLEEGASHDWFESNLIVGATLVSIFGAVGFVIRELSAPSPAVNLRLFRDRTFTTGTLVMAAVMSVLMSGMFLLPLFMQEMLGFTAMQSGLALMPRTVVMVFAMPIVGKLYNRFPPALFAAVGLFLAAYGQYMLAGMTLDSGSSQVLASIMLQGLGMSMMFVPLSTLSLSTIPRPQLSDATGLSSLLRQIGGSMGLAVMTTLLTRYSTGAREALKWQLSPDRPEVAGLLRATANAAIAKGMDPANAHSTALASLAGRVMREGTVIGFEKTFAVGALLFLAVSPLVFLLRAPKAAGPVAHVEIEV